MKFTSISTELKKNIMNVETMPINAYNMNEIIINKSKPIQPKLYAVVTLDS